MKFKHLIIFCIALSCTTDNDNTIEQQFWINSTKVTCTGAFEQQCYNVQNNETIIESDWNLFYDPINGFDSIYEEGFIYRIKVEREDVPNPPADASSYKYTFIELISKDIAN